MRRQKGSPHSLSFSSFFFSSFSFSFSSSAAILLDNQNQYLVDYWDLLHMRLEALSLSYQRMSLGSFSFSTTFSFLSASFRMCGSKQPSLKKQPPTMLKLLCGSTLAQRCTVLTAKFLFFFPFFPSLFSLCSPPSHPAPLL